MVKKSELVKKNLFKIAFVFFFILCFGWQCYAEPESFEALATGLPDGVYMIERVNFMPPAFFASEKEAKAWIEAVKKNPEIVKPDHEFFQLYLSGNDFIIHQLTRTDRGGYESNSNFLVSVSSKASWAFEEAANRVTIITNSVGLENEGPVAGLLKTGASFCNELRNPGLSVIDLSSVKQMGSNQFIGRVKQGGSFEGKIQSNAQGKITNIVCKVSNAAKLYDLNFDFYYDELIKQLSQVSVSERQAGETAWCPMVQYAIKHDLPLTNVLAMDVFWRQFTNSNTLLVLYDSKNRTTLIHRANGANLPLAKGDSGGLGAGFNHARWLVLSLIGISTVFGVFIIMKSQNRADK
jgi:hypothetical protein